jgi:hypothetical protein
MAVRNADDVIDVLPDQELRCLGGYSTATSPTPTTRPTSCPPMNRGTAVGAMPVNVLVNTLPIVTAGFANEAEDVNQHAAPI